VGLHGKVLVAGGRIGMASVRSCEKLPPCLIKPVPAISKTDPLLAKAKPIGDGGSTSVITYLTREKICSKTAVKREVRDDVRETTLQTSRSVKKEGEEVFETPEQSLPLQPTEQTMVRQAVPLQHMEVHSGADLHM